MRKIAEASVFVADITFVGPREGKGLLSNPNVLIEYGLALKSPGDERIITVTNDSFGAPNEIDIPFNLRHRRFPVAYTLREDATEDERRSAKKLLVSKLDSALRTILVSPGYRQSLVSQRPPSALVVAGLHHRALDHKAACDALGYGDGVQQVRELVQTLLDSIKTKCEEIEAAHSFGSEVGEAATVGALSFGCLAKTDSFAIDTTWEQPFSSSTQDARLNVRAWQGRLYFPGRFPGGVHFSAPRQLDQRLYLPTLSEDYELGWVMHHRGSDDPAFVSSVDLADEIVARLVNYLRGSVPRR